MPAPGRLRALRQAFAQPRPGASIALGLVGAILGYLIFTVLLGIGDTDIFDFGGIISAIIGTVIVILIAGFFLRRRGATGL